ncbi:SDR family oxidoreductase [Pontibacter sp. JH31]|uniref:SDR family oxidoreductase n=1 Tax=Pontibacter aquaedesilientis TaxID=2766980 RepID=A0ABR7XJ55_9BACT|nr:SDR family oxidoreductase [Pontibacter aquaedesilientis]MBD1398324.1 SDR family oxidoreductase [Pontibacter aquaedesilientis]
MQETILVTGATGTVGHEIVKQLAMQDVNVRAGVHSIIKGENLKRLPDVDIVEIDFKKPESLHAAFTHIDRLMLITPLSEGQLEMAKNLVDEAKKQQVKHIVKLSALGAGASPGIKLGQWHREIERYIEESGIPYTFLRSASFMQNLVNYHTESIISEGKFYMPVGEGKVSYIDTRDIAAVAIEALTTDGHAGRIYDLTGPEAISHSEMAAHLSEQTGKEIQFVDIPEEKARQAMRSQHMPEQIVDAMLELYVAHKSGKSSSVTNTVQEVTGRPPHTFQQFAKDYHECF